MVQVGRVLDGDQLGAFDDEAQFRDGGVAIGQQPRLEVVIEPCPGDDPGAVLRRLVLPRGDLAGA